MRHRLRAQIIDHPQRNGEAKQTIPSHVINTLAAGEPRSGVGGAPPRARWDMFMGAVNAPKFG
jgi:hypothetical protein